MLDYVFSKNGYPIGYKEPDCSYWAAKIRSSVNGQADYWLCEMDTIDTDLVRGVRKADWTLDIIGTGDIKRISELWLICPPTATSPLGNTARLPITQDGTAFQLKVAYVESNGMESFRHMQAHVIGRVEDVETGACVCFIFDYGMQAMSRPWYSNVYDFGTWRQEVAPLKHLNFQVVGLDLPERQVV